MADPPRTYPAAPDDATRVQTDDATRVQPAPRVDDATVVATGAPPTGTASGGDEAHRTFAELEPVQGAAADGTVVSAGAAQGSAVVGAAGESGRKADADIEDTEHFAFARGRTAQGVVSTAGTATVATGRVGRAPVARAVLLGLVTGLSLFALTALWLLRGH